MAEVARKLGGFGARDVTHVAWAAVRLPSVCAAVAANGDADWATDGGGGGERIAGRGTEGAVDGGVEAVGGGGGEGCAGGGDSERIAGRGTEGAGAGGGVQGPVDGGAAPASIRERLMARVAEVLPSLSPQDLATVLWALASTAGGAAGTHAPDALSAAPAGVPPPSQSTLHQRSSVAPTIPPPPPPPPWTAAVCSAVARRSNRLKPQELSLVLWSLAVLRSRPPPTAARALWRGTLHRVGAFNAQVQASGGRGGQAWTRSMHSWEQAGAGVDVGTFNALGAGPHSPPPLLFHFFCSHLSSAHTPLGIPVFLAPHLRGAGLQQCVCWCALPGHVPLSAWPPPPVPLPLHTHSLSHLCSFTPPHTQSLTPLFLVPSHTHTHTPLFVSLTFAEVTARHDRTAEYVLVALQGRVRPVSP
eukprot:365538-Chlamydomonas_euryale.AAC.1